MDFFPDILLKHIFDCLGFQGFFQNDLGNALRMSWFETVHQFIHIVLNLLFFLRQAFFKVVHEISI